MADYTLSFTQETTEYTVEFTQAARGPQGDTGPAGTTTWDGITDKPATFPPTAHTHPSTDISDSTAAGRAILTAADAAAQRTALGAQAIINDGDLSIAKTSGLQTALDSAQPKQIPPNAEFVFEGDSITNPNLIAYPTQTSWVPHALTLPNFTGRGAANNVAVSGSTYSSMIARYAASVYPLRPTSGEPVYLITMIGSNDGSTSAATWISALESYWITAKADGFTVVAVTPPIHSANTNTLNFAAAIRRSTVPNIIVDLGRAFKNSTNDTLFLSDDLHPTAQGAKLIAEAVNAQIVYTPNPGQQSVTFASTGIGAGTSHPQAAGDFVGLNSILIGDNRTANTDKIFNINAAPYSSETGTQTSILGGFISSSESPLYVGRGSSSNYGATRIDFYTAATNTTLGGTLYGRINSSGKWHLGANSSTASTSTLNLLESGAALRLSQSTATQQTSSIIGLPSASGNIATGSLSGELVIASPSATGVSFATNTSGNTQVVRVRIKDSGVINTTSAAIPNYADDTAADAALASGDLYTTTAGGRTVFRKP